MRRVFTSTNTMRRRLSSQINFAVCSLPSRQAIYIPSFSENAQPFFRPRGPVSQSFPEVFSLFRRLIQPRAFGRHGFQSETDYAPDPKQQNDYPNQIKISRTEEESVQSEKPIKNQKRPSPPKRSPRKTISRAKRSSERFLLTIQIYRRQAKSTCDSARKVSASIGTSSNHHEVKT